VTARNGQPIGQITSGIFSPRLDCNVGMSMIAAGHWDIGTELLVHTPDGITREGVIAALPF
jgi:dimethylsulfoniopropionate demethylase